MCHKSRRGGGNSVVSIPSQKPDEFVKQGGEEKENKKLSTGAKVGIGAAILASAGLIIAAVVRGKGNNALKELEELEKLCSKKLVKVNLPERIEFKEAKTLEEAIEYSKNVLGIKEVDNKFSLFALNDTNRTLTNVANRSKGDLYMPTALKYESMADDTCASFATDCKSKDFGSICINSKFYDGIWLDKKLNEHLFFNNNPMFSFDENFELVKANIQSGCLLTPDKNLAKLMKQYYDDASKLTISEKRNLFMSMLRANDKLSYFTQLNPISLLKHISRSDIAGNLKIDLDYWSKQPIDKTSDYLKNLLKQLRENNKYMPRIAMEEIPAARLTYHEMGHLQDFAKNYKKFFKTINGFWNRYATFRYFEDTPKEDVLNCYPEFKEFIQDKKIQKTVAKVSAYAQEGKGEFIADTYAILVSGKTLDNDVMELYKRFGGPELPNM